MSLGTLLRTHVESTGKEQQVLAIEWLEQMGARLESPPKLTTVEQRLSQLLGDRDKGFRFFFGTDRTRATTLFDVLGVLENDRLVLVEMADRLARTGSDKSLAWVIDTTTWPAEREACAAWFQAIEDEILPNMLPRPIALILTHDQYRWLPRTFDDFGDHLLLVRVAEADEAQVQVDILVEDGTIRVGPRPSGALDRWLAMDWTDDGFQLHPPNGLANVRQHGVVEQLKRVEHPLYQLTTQAVEPETRPEGAIALRQLLVDLADPDQAASGGTPEERLWWSLEFSVPATSTPRERTEQALAVLVVGLGMEPEPATPDALQHRLDRAARRPTAPTLLRVGDVLHAINLPDDLKAEPPLLQVHQVRCAVPVLTRLREAVAEWTTDDADDDRFLERTIAALDPDGTERQLFHHARATLLVNKELQPREPARDADWKEALTAILDGPPPAAELRMLRVGAQGEAVSTDDGHILAVAQEREDWTPTQRPQVDDLVPVGTPTVRRGHELQVLTRRWPDRNHPPGPDSIEVYSTRVYPEGQRGWNVGRLEGYSFDRTEPSLPEVLDGFERVNDLQGRHPRSFVPISDSPVSIDRWLDAVEASADFGASAGEAVRFERAEGDKYRHEVPYFSSLQASPVNIPAQSWHQADRLLAMVWLALREALDRGTAATLHDGTVLLPLRVGIVAELHPRVHGAKSAPSQGVVTQGIAVVDHLPVRFQTLTAPVTSWSGKSAGYSTQIGLDLPRGVRLSGHGYRVDISFTVSPFFSDGPPAPAAFASVAGGGPVARDD